MKNRRSLYLVLPAAALVAFAAPSIAGAQEPTPTPTPTEPAPLPTPTEPTTPTPAMPAPQDTTPTDVAPPAQEVSQDTVSFGTLISALNNVEGETQELQALSEVKPENVTVVSVADVAAQESAATAVLDAAMQKAEPNVGKLRESLSANAAVNGVLESGSVQADNVVAADVSADGKVTVFVKPSQP